MFNWLSKSSWWIVFLVMAFKNANFCRKNMTYIIDSYSGVTRVGQLPQVLTGVEGKKTAFAAAVLLLSQQP